jgi:hypothetical protein
VRFVAVLGIVGREVDVPAPVDRVQLGCPYVAGVRCVGWWPPYDVLFASLLKLEQAVRRPYLDRTPGCECLRTRQPTPLPSLNTLRLPARTHHVVRPLVPHDIRIRTAPICDGQDGIIVMPRRLHMHLPWKAGHCSFFFCVVCFLADDVV